LRDLFEENPSYGGSLERYLAREHLERHDAQGIEIAPSVDLALACGLFGTHVGGSAYRNAGSGQGAPADVCEGLGNPEVRDHDSSPRSFKQDVVRLDVSMHHAHGVGKAERIGRFLHNSPGFLGREALSAAQPCRKRLSIDVAHDEIDETSVLAYGMDWDDMGMGQPSCGLGLSRETLPNLFAEG
jgi:hypothetical protein